MVFYIILMCCIPLLAASIRFHSPIMNKYELEKVGEHKETPCNSKLSFFQLRFLTHQITSNDCYC